METIAPDWEFDRFDDGSQSKSSMLAERPERRRSGTEAAVCFQS